MTHHGYNFLPEPMPARVIGTQRVAHAHKNKQTNMLAFVILYKSLSLVSSYLYRQGGIIASP